MTGLRQTAKSGAGLHKPGSRSHSARLLRALPQSKTGHNLVIEKFFKKSFENPKVPETGTDNGSDPRQSGRNIAPGAP